MSSKNPESDDADEALQGRRSGRDLSGLNAISSALGWSLGGDETKDKIRGVGLADVLHPVQVVGCVEEDRAGPGAADLAVDGNFDSALLDDDHLLVGVAVRCMRNLAWSQSGNVTGEIIERGGGAVEHLASFAGLGRYHGELGSIENRGFHDGFLGRFGCEQTGTKTGER